jgi:hypothetical protein
MQLVFCGMCALAVALIFYGWRDYQNRLAGRASQLRARVAYMLWVTAGDPAD